MNVFEGHQQEIYSLDFSKDGRLIVSGSGDRTTRIWSMLDGACIVLTINDADSANNDAGVTSVAISPNGRLVAAGSLDTVVRIWDVSTGVLVQKLRGHQDSVYSVVFTPDGRSLVSGSLDRTLKCWDVSSLATGLPTKSPGDHSPFPTSVDFVGHKVFLGYRMHRQTSINTGCYTRITSFRLVFLMTANGSHPAPKIAVSNFGIRDRPLCSLCCMVIEILVRNYPFCLKPSSADSWLPCAVISLDLNPQDSSLATGSGDSVARICMY